MQATASWHRSLHSFADLIGSCGRSWQRQAFFHLLAVESIELKETRAHKAARRSTEPLVHWRRVCL